MNSSLPWQIEGIRRHARDTAQEAARRAGMSVSEWLERIILDSASHHGIDPAQLDPSPTDLAAHIRRPTDDLTRRAVSQAHEHSSTEAAECRRATNGYPLVAGEAELVHAARSSDPLPRPRTQELSILERQLRQINSDIETSASPYGLDNAVNTLRDDLADIALMLQEAMPRKAIEALENEVRNLADRIDRSVGAEVESPALTSVAHGLAEVRDALRGLTPAENLAGLDRAVREVSRKIDRLASDAQDPSVLLQFEVAITMMRQIASRAASSDALADLCEEVRTLARKIDQGASSGLADTLAALEARVVTLADALERRVPLLQETQASSPIPDIEPLSSAFGELPITEEIAPAGSFPVHPGEAIESTGTQMLKAGGPHTAERRPTEISAAKSSFIAAARRAAQAARRDAPHTINPRPRLDRSTAGKRRRRRAVAASIAAVVLALGSLQIVTTLWSSGENPATDGDRGIVSGSIPADAQPATRDAAVADTSPTKDHIGGSPAEAPEPAEPAPQLAAERSDSAAALAIPEVPVPAAPDTLPAAFGSPLRMAAARGDANAQYEIAVRYFEGRDVPQDPRAAADWFGRAAEQGLAPAQFRLGGLYEKGLGVEKDLKAARRFYLAAGEAGHAKALHNLAVLCAEGIDGKPDYRTAASWFRKAAAYGVADSQYNLGVLYARGIGVEQNLAEAYKWFALAARAGDLEAARKRDNLGTRLDQQSLQAALQEVRAWTPQRQPDAAVPVETPVGD